MFAAVAAILLLLVSIGTSVAVVHLDAVAPLLVTCGLLMLAIGQSARRRS